MDSFEHLKKQKDAIIAKQNKKASIGSRPIERIVRRRDRILWAAIWLKNEVGACKNEILVVNPVLNTFIESLIYADLTKKGIDLYKEKAPIVYLTDEDLK